MKISSTFCQQLGPQILSLMNRKNQPNGEKKIILFVALLKWIL
jgi:hypothetical protein